MFGEYNQSSRPLSAQSPGMVYNTDYYGYERPMSCNDVGIIHSSNVYKYCADLLLEKTKLIRQNHRLHNSVEKMLKNKETEVWNEVSITLDDLYRENSLLKEKISVEERRRISEISSIPYDQVACIRGRYYKSLEENAEIERKLRRKEKEVWDLKETLEETESELKWLEDDLKEKETDAIDLRQRIIEVDKKYRKCFDELNKSRKQCDIIWTRWQEQKNENNHLRREHEKRRSLFSRNEFFPHELYNNLQSIKEENQKLKDKIKDKENEFIAIWQEKREIAEKHMAALRQKESELSATRRSLEYKETELKSLRLRSEEEEKANLLLPKKHSDYHHLNKEIDTLKRENSSLEKILRECLESFDDTEQKLKRSSASVLFLEKENQQLRDKMSHFKRGEVLQGHNSNMETEAIKRFKEEASSKEKEIRRLQERINTEERKTAQLQNDFSEFSKQKDSLLQRKDSKLQELLHDNQRLRNEVTRLNSGKSNQPKEESVFNTIKLNEIERELSTKRKDIDSLNERIRQLENENMLLQKEKDSVSKDRHNLHARNSNAADEVKILQTEVEGKQIEIKRLKDKCILDEKQNKELQKNYSKVSEERENLFERNQRLQDELNKLNAKIRHLEENRMETTDEWNHLDEIKDTVELLRNDNDRLKQHIDTLSKEKENALSRYYDAEKEVRHLKLDTESKDKEIQRLQKKITQKEGDNEKLQERLINISKEKQQLMESNKRLEKVNGQMLLATDESKRWQEKIKELQNENRHLRHDIDGLSKQKEDAIKRIRDFESVNTNYNDQLLLAADESKRLQGKIKDLQGENSRLRRDIDDLSKQKEDALTRLSKVAGAKLTHGNAAITDLSDTDRPTKLAEKFSELYDNAWTDAFEELDNTFHNEEETIKVLLRIFQEAYKFCVDTEKNYETRIGQAVFTLASKTESHQIKNANVEIQKVLADLRISLSTACCSVIEEMVLSKLPSILKSVDVAACPLTKLFARQCASLSWKMRIRDPPLFVRFEFRCGSTFNSDVLKRYTKTGGYLDFLVWPALYLQENGPVLAKGVAQPKIAP